MVVVVVDVAYWGCGDGDCGGQGSNIVVIREDVLVVIVVVVVVEVVGFVVGRGSCSRSTWSTSRTSSSSRSCLYPAKWGA